MIIRRGASIIVYDNNIPWCRSIKEAGEKTAVCRLGCGDEKIIKGPCSVLPAGYEEGN